MKLENRLYTSAQSKALDSSAIMEFGFSGSDLMQRAGERAFSNITHRYGYPSSMVVMCGPGNNGGDGYVLASCALKIGIEVTALQFGESKTNESREKQSEFLQLGGRVTCPDQLESLQNTSIIVDAIFGTGLKRAPEGFAAKAISICNKLVSPVVSLDCPSGLNADTGSVYNPCIQAEQTIVFISNKIGLYTGEGRGICGEVVYEDLGISSQVHESIPVSVKLMDTPRIAPRKINSHKGDFGHVVIAGGNDGMLGAVLLAGKSALRTGSGLVTILSTQHHMDKPAIYQPELMSQCLENPDAADDVIDRCNVFVLGPGLGQNSWSERLFEKVVNRAQPKIIDADGLNILSRSGIYSDNHILTPHPGEAGRLLNCKSSDIQNDRLGAAREIVRKYGGVCVLKGSGTVVADSGQWVLISRNGNPGMASAGMGDVLSGVISAWGGMGHNALEAACNGVWLHSTSADHISKKMGQYSLVASDVVDYLPDLISRLELSF